MVGGPYYGARPTFEPEDISKILDDIKESLETGQLMLGPKTKAFEEAFAKYIGVKHAIAVNSATSALQITLQYYGVEGKEVVVPTNTFIATPNSVLYAGGKPVLCDMDPETLCASPEDIAAVLTENTAGVVIVHVGGLIHPRIDEIRTMCKEKKLFLIEDASHAQGSSLDGKKAGSLCDAACFSFNPVKVFPIGAGGMITTDDNALAEAAISMRHHGEDGGLTNIVRFGNCWYMSEIHAALGIHNVPRLDGWVQRRTEIAKMYAAGVADCDGVRVVTPPDNSVCAYYKCSFVLDPSINGKKLIEVLRKEYEIYSGALYWPTCHMQPLYREKFGYKEEDFPKASATMKQVVCLPLHLKLTDEDVQHIISCFCKVVEQVRA